MQSKNKPDLTHGQEGIEEIDPQTGEIFLYDGRESRKLITTEAIGAFPERVKELHGSPLCCSIAGEIDDTAILTKPDNSMEFTALVGDFEAVVYNNDGSIKSHSKAAMCFLPGGAHEQALTAVKKWQEARAAWGENPVAQELPQPAFYLDFHSEESGNPRGYRWMWRNRLRYDPSKDRLAKLSEQRQLSLAAERRAKGEGDQRLISN